jgi:hypothetical protein
VVQIGTGKSISTYTYAGEFHRFITEYKTLDNCAVLKIVQCITIYSASQYAYKGEATFKFSTGDESNNHSKFVLKVYNEN